MGLMKNLARLLLKKKLLEFGRICKKLAEFGRVWPNLAGGRRRGRRRRRKRRKFPLSVKAYVINLFGAYKLRPRVSTGTVYERLSD